MDYYSTEDLIGQGFVGIDDSVLIHRTATIVNPTSIRWGRNIRIDAQTVITAGKTDCYIGNYVHISTHVFIAGRAGFIIDDYSGLASGVRALSTSDNFSGKTLTGPTHAASLIDVAEHRIKIGQHAVAGANAVMMPGAELGEGAILGSLSLAKTALRPWTIYGGVPAKPLKSRSRELLDLV